MKLLIFSSLLYVLSLLYVNIRYPYEMQSSLVGNNLWINPNLILWIYQFSKLLFLISIGYTLKKNTLILSNELYPIHR